MNNIAKKLSLVIGLLMVAALSSKAQDPIAVGEMVLPCAEQQSSDHIVFPAIKNNPGKFPTLKARIFFNAPVAGGWNNCTIIVLITPKELKKHAGIR